VQIGAHVGELRYEEEENRNAEGEQCLRDDETQTKARNFTNTDVKM